MGPSISVIEPQNNSSDRPVQTAQEDNDMSLLGLDRDNDYIRDDVERVIYNKYNANLETRQVAYRYAFLIQTLFLDVTRTGQPGSNLMSNFYFEPKNGVTGFVEDYMLNTPERMRMFERYIKDTPTNPSK